mgnify:CR=1 FL=1
MKLLTRLPLFTRKPKKHHKTLTFPFHTDYPKSHMSSTITQHGGLNSKTHTTLGDFKLKDNLRNVEYVTKTFLPEVRKLRLQNLRNYLKKFSCSAGLFHDPCHIRYACDASNMTIWHKRNQVRYLLVPVSYTHLTLPTNREV